MRCSEGASRSLRELFLAATVTRLLGRQELGADLLFDLAGDFLVLLEVRAGVVLALADAAALVGIPGTRLLDDALGTRHVDDLAFAGDALAVHDLELGLAERRGHLVL